MVIPVNPKMGIFWEYMEVLPKKRSNVKVKVRLLKVSGGGEASILGTAMVFLSEIRALESLCSSTPAAAHATSGKVAATV